MNIVFRKAEVRDIKDMAELDKVCFSVPWSQKAFEQEIQDNDLAMYIVADIEGRLVGYAGLWSILDEGHVTNVAVHPDFRKQGIGKKLVTELINIAESKGIKSQTLEVRPSNDAAIALYTKLGFKPAGIRKKYYEDNGEDALIMWRNE